MADRISAMGDNVYIHNHKDTELGEIVADETANITSDGNITAGSGPNDKVVAGDAEKYFQNVVYLVFRLMGFYVDVERASSRGRADVVVQAKDYVYVIELKLDGTAADALRQIEERGYAAPFAASGRKVYRIGVAFSSATRGISEWAVE